MRAFLVVTVLAAVLGGCVTSAPSLPSLAGSDITPERLPAPETSGVAQAYLTAALGALRAGKAEHAALFVDAILRSDHLTDRGRANMYWLAAEAHRLAGHDVELVDSLGGFLVSAAVIGDNVEADDDIRRREVEARATLVARKVKVDPTLGKSKDDAIPVEDAREPSGIVAELGCIEDGVANHGEGLEERRVHCERDPTLFVLWFDLTHSAR